MYYDAINVGNYIKAAHNIYRSNFPSNTFIVMGVVQFIVYVHFIVGEISILLSV